MSKFAAVALALALAARVARPETCLGLGECPDFPLPYLPGEYPTSYSYEGSFPEDFVWGLGTAAYQVEGAYNEDGRGASIWDTFTGADTVGMTGSVCGAAPCPVNDGQFAAGATGNVACDAYHKYKQDVALMKSLGLKHYRFSISWPRVVPTGNVSDGVNEAGLAYYDALIDELLANGITPYVTLYHWDLPQALLDESRGMQGWYSVDETGQPNGQIVPLFVEYADLVFSRYGDRVKTWLTFNEAWTFLYLGCEHGKAPSVEPWTNISIWPYIGGHNVLNAHAQTVALYRTKHAPTQGGRISMTNNVDWREPMSDDPQDVGAAERSTQFWQGWFADPVFFGDYPNSMKELLGDRLPSFTAEESALLKGSVDFMTMNHYGTAWISNIDEPGWMECYGNTSEVGFPAAQSIWLYGAGWGLRKLLNWAHNRYGGPEIMMTEGGWSLAADTAAEAQHDVDRAAYYANYTSEMLKAIEEDGINVTGYFAWSLMDNFEWERGYAERFGAVFNDFGFGYDPNAPVDNGNQPTTNQTRTPKDSACWLSQLWTTNQLASPDSVQC